MTTIHMDILLLQLPLIDHNYNYIYGNIEYAPAVINSYLRHKFPGKTNTTVLPTSLSCFGSDMKIISYISSLQPNLVGFTCYLWNIERNMHIAQLLKEKLGDVIIVFGGPEIENGSIALQSKREEVDYFVSGEGEWFFNLFLTGADLSPYSQKINGNNLFCQPLDDLFPVNQIFEPYTNRLLNTGLDGTIYLELTRGCPYMCSYCFYSKRAFRIRELPFETLLKSLSMTKTLKEIYILSPTFNASPDFSKKLTILEKANPGIKLHTEIRAENIDDATAKQLYNAGFRSLEVGLQTLNQNALTCVGRKSNPEKELKGMISLKEAEIDLKIGIIPGLPNDTPEFFIHTIDRLISLGLKNEIELYPLMVLPGTAIGDYAENNEVNYQRKPPYYFLENETFKHSDIQHIINYTEDATGYSHNISMAPDLTSNDEGLLTKGLSFNGDNKESWDISNYIEKIETNVFSFLIELEDIESFYHGLLTMKKGLPPSELFNVIFINDSIINEQIITNILNQHEENTFYQRLHAFDSWVEGLRIRFYQMFEDYSLFEIADVSYLFTEPILIMTKKNLKLINKSKNHDINLYIPENTYEICKEFIIDNFKYKIERISFQSEYEQKEFYREVGYEYIELPYSFKIEKI